VYCAGYYLEVGCGQHILQANLKNAPIVSLM